MIRRLLLAAGLLLACAGAASASTFSLVTAPATLPSAQVPNLPGSIVLTPPPARPEQLSYAELSALWHEAGAAYGIPWQVLAAINKVESNFGRNMGPSSATPRRRRPRSRRPSRATSSSRRCTRSTRPRRWGG